MPKAAIHTLGCKVNQYDSDRLMSELAHYGYETTDFNKQADLYIVNTCTVTQTGAAKSLQTLRKIKSKNPGAIIAACGCHVKISPADVLNSGADFIFDACKPRDLVEFLNVCAASAAKKNVVLQKKRTRAYIKIQDGCDRFCSYCIVPYARGALYSRPPEEIIAEAEALIQSGVREVVLTGIQAAAYGKDTNVINFPRLIRQVSALTDLKRLRLGSIEPYAVDGEFLDAVSAEKVCPHLHLSLQSGCDKTLEAMNRRYTTDYYRKAVDGLRERKPGCALTTDIMVGFPGETDADFDASIKFVREMEFARAHVFIYSPRKGTPAEAMPGQVPSGIKTQRGKLMRELAKQLELNYLQKHIGTKGEVLFESKHGLYWEGHTADYIKVCAESERNLTNEILNVSFDKADSGILYGGIL